MKKIVFISILFVFISCKNDSKLIIKKPSNDAIMYYRGNALENNLIDSISFTYFDKGAMNYLEGNFNKAKEFYEIANDIQPNNTIILNALGSVEAELENYELCEYYFQKSLELDSLDSDTYMNFGTAYNKLEDFDNSIKILKKGLNITKNNNSKGFLYYNLANSYFKKNDYKKSNFYNEKALEIVNIEAARRDILELKKVLSEKIN